MDIKTYSTVEAKAEWDHAPEGKRRMFLARINRRDSDMAMKSWDEFNVNERKLIHGGLNEDFSSPVWYINTNGQRINKIVVSIVQKTPEQLADEVGKRFWEDLPFEDRFSALLKNGIGRDVEQGQFSSWDNLSRDLRDWLIEHFAAKSAVGDKAVVTRRRPTILDQLELF